MNIVSDYITTSLVLKAFLLGAGCLAVSYIVGKIAYHAGKIDGMHEYTRNQQK